MSLTKDRKQFPRLAPSNGHEESDMLSLFQRVLDRAFVRFDQRFEKMTSTVSEGLNELVDLQKRSMKKLDRLNLNMRQLVKQIDPEAASFKNETPEQQRSIDGEEGEPNDTNHVSYESVPIAPSKINSHKSLKFAESQLGMRPRYELAARPKRSINRLAHLGDEPVVRQEDLLTMMNRKGLVQSDPRRETVPKIDLQTIQQDGLVTPSLISREPPAPAASQPLNVPEELLKMAVGTQLGEYCDRKVIIPLNQPIEGVTLTPSSPKEQLFSYIYKWIGCVTDNITKEAFNGYFTKQMSIFQTKVFVCNHIILSFHKMMEFVRQNYPKFWNLDKGELIHTYQEQQIKALEYYQIKYPLKSKVFLSAEVNNMLEEKNDIHNLPEYNMLRRFGVKFNTLHLQGSERARIVMDTTDQNFNRKIKLFINAAVQEARIWFMEFSKIMQEVFLIPNPVDPSQRVALKDTRIGMKFKPDMPLYSEDEIQDIGVPIKSPEVLRVLIKWINKLDEIAKEPEVHIIDSQDYTKMGMNNIEMFMKTRYDRELANCIVEHYKEEFDTTSLERSILASAFNSLPDYIQRYRSTFEFLPEHIYKSGMTVNLMSTLTCDVVILALEKIITFLYRMHKKAIEKVGNAAFRLLKLDQELLPFTVYDILRAKFSGTAAQMQQVIRNLQTNKDITIVRIKNRFDTGNRDYLINFMFKECKLICEIQVGLKEVADEKSISQQKFSHFLYAIYRSRFGPLSESALIMDYQLEVGHYFKDMTKRIPREAKRLDFTPIMVKDKITIEGYEVMPSTFTFLCNKCLKISCERLLSTWKEKDKDSYLCGKCVYGKLNFEQKAIFALGMEIGQFYQGISLEEETREKSEYLAVIISDSLRKVEYYSTREPERPRNTYESFRTKIQKYPYYICFSDLSKFHVTKPYQTKKFFRLKKELVQILLRIDEPHPGRGPWVKRLKDCHYDEFPENKDRYPYIDSIEEEDFTFHWAFSSSLTTKPQTFETVRCAMDHINKTILVLDFDRDYFRFLDARERYLNNTVQRENKRWMFDWNYENQNFDDALLEGLREDDVVETMKMNGNHFTKINLFKSQTLERLMMNHNIIHQVVVEDNYPSLMELSLIGNCLETLDFTLINLPKLETLNVSNNVIREIVLPKEERLNRCPHLKVLTMKFNRLTEFAVPPQTFPELQKIGLSFNKDLKKLNLNGFRSLRKLEASNIDLEELIMEGDYLRLNEITIEMTKLEKCDLSHANMPKLVALSFSSSLLRSFEFPINLQSIISVNLDHNCLTELRMGTKKSTMEMPRLRDLFLQCNQLRKVDLTPLGACISLLMLDVSLNDELSLVFCRDVDFDQKMIKRVSTHMEESTIRWMMNNCPEQILRKFRKSICGNTIGDVVLTADFVERMPILTSASYISNMLLPKEQEDHNKIQATVLCREFLHWIKDTEPSIYKRLLPFDGTEQHECYFLHQISSGLDSYEQIIKTFEVPLASQCASCHKSLEKPPYYYGIQSKLHRCVECTEKHDETSSNRLKRYIVNESSILLLADRIVDQLKLDQNIQPSNPHDCKEHSFVCNGCAEQIASQPRYICLGCRRLPNFFHSEPVDFCLKCARKLASSDDHAKAEVLLRSASDGHTLSHALLRVLYAVDNKEH